MFIFSFLAGRLPAEECRGDLKMNVTGLKNSSGQIKFDLDNSAETFKPKRGAKPSFQKGKAPVNNQKAEYTFKDIPCGDYAIKIYHDENKNEDLDTNFLRVPTEDYSFSNCSDCLVPPSWEKARFKFSKESKEINVSF